MKFITFDKILFASAMLLAMVAGYFSIIGIATLFAGATISVIIMAFAIEISKICAVTFLYRYWNKTIGFLKTYLSIAAIVLMLITSLGIFGYLSAAYQKSSIEFKSSQEKIVMIEGQKSYLNDKISQSKIRIKTLNDMRQGQESRLSETLTNAFLTRNPIQLKQIQDQTIEMVKSADESIKTEQDKIQSTTDEIHKIDQQVNDMKFASANTKDIRTFQFVAEQFGTTLDKVAKWFILVIIFVFDPLAVALILAYNVVAYKTTSEVVNLPSTSPPESPSITSPPESPSIPIPSSEIKPRPTWLH
jgi:hypothetical protein